MAPLWLMTLYDDYEVINNTIAFKENGNVVYEFPIPRGYYLIGMIENFSNGKLFMFSKNKIERPKSIPSGYTNLTLSSYGLYKVESEESFLYTNDSKIQSKRELYYMDTSHITPHDFKLACNGCYSVNEDDIPKNFWFSTQFRDLVNEYLETPLGKWRDWIMYKDINPYLNAFDLRARVINEYEFISILAYNQYGKYNDILLEEGSEFERLMYTDKVIFGGAWVNVENFFKIVTSVENKDIFLCVNAEKRIEEPFCNYISHPIYIKDDQPYPWFAIPVIEEYDSNVKTLKSK